MTSGLREIALTLCVIYIVIFECQKQVTFNMTVFFTEALGVTTALAFGIQTKPSFLEY